MVRLSDLHPEEAEGMRNFSSTTVKPGPWLTPKPLTESKIALVSTAGLHRRHDAPFKPGELGYRLIPGDVDAADLVTSHVSVNWDRSGLEQDVNVVLPIDRLRDLAQAEAVETSAKTFRAETVESVKEMLKQEREAKLTVEYAADELRGDREVALAREHTFKP